MITIINALTFTTGSVLGILIGYFIEHHLARSRGIEAIRIVEFNKGAAEFRAVFVETIWLLRDNIEKGHTLTNKILHSDTLLLHEKAKILFEPYLASSDLSGFNSAWENYMNCKVTCYEQTDEDIKSISTCCLGHLNSLLFYAHPKTIS